MVLLNCYGHFIGGQCFFCCLEAAYKGSPKFLVRQASNPAKIVLPYHFELLVKAIHHHNLQLA
jgi:hypothetical protein